MYDQAQIPAHIQTLHALSESQNIASDMKEAALGMLAQDVLQEYDIDHSSMKDWRERMERGLKLASLMRDPDRSKPFDGASDVIFPLVTSAALQFNARAYPAIVQPEGIVKCKVHGSDPRGVKAARALRVSQFMSETILSKIPEWETETDALLTQLPIVGTMLRKVWWDDSAQRQRIKLCDAGSVTINDKVKSLELAPRISEELLLYPYEIEERKRAGVFLAVDLDDDGDEDKDAPQAFVEQHRRIDLDGDGYGEPYIVTVHKASQKIVRVVANFEMADVVADQERVISIARRDHYAVYHFLPSMDGGFWGTGLGMLLGDISQSINAVVNQLIDAGTLNNIGGGFIGAKDFRARSGEFRFKPFEWKQVQAYGDDLRKAIVPLPKVEPSPVMFQMLGLLIEAGREIASVKDVMTGDASRQMTATTTLALIEQGQMVFTAAYKRIYRALKEEFRMIADIMARTTNDREYSVFHDITDQQGRTVMIPAQADLNFEDMDISPVADPRAVTAMQSMARAQFLTEMAGTGMVDPAEAAKRSLEAAQIENPEKLLPKPNPVQQQLEAAQADHAVFMLGMAKGEAQVKVAKMLAEIREIEAGIEHDANELRLEGVKVALDNANTEVERLLEMARDVDRRNAERMAGQPNNAGGYRVPAFGSPLSQAPDFGRLVGNTGSIPGGGGPLQGSAGNL